MKEFEQYDPRNPQPGYQLLKIFLGPQRGSKSDYYFLKEGEHLLIYTEELHKYPETSPVKPGQTKLIVNQLEMPLSGVRWFIDVIEQKFSNPPEAGGLAADSLSTETVIDGEELHVMRVVYADCKDPGYDLTNGSRRSHISNSQLQRRGFSDHWLFEGGLMDFLKQLADDYERGNL